MLDLGLGLGLKAKFSGLGLDLGLPAKALFNNVLTAQSHNKIQTNPEQTVRPNYLHAFDFVNKVESIVCCAYFRQIR